MKIYAVKNDKDIYPNIGDGLLEVSESRPTFFRLVGNNRHYQYRDFTFYDRNGVPLPESYRESEPHKQTKADEIRSMTDEELADFIINFDNRFGEEYEGEQSCLSWLQKESEEQ